MCIWASDKELAGCIDLAAIDEKGRLVCLGFRDRHGKCAKVNKWFQRERHLLH